MDDVAPPRKYPPPLQIPRWAFVPAMVVFAVAAFFFVMINATWLRPTPLLTLFEIAVFATPALVVVFCRRERWMTWTFLATSALAAVLVLTPWHPRKRFIADLESIPLGATVDEVRAAMVGYELRCDETWTGPTPYGRYAGGPGDRQLVYAWSDNADTGDITFLNGRVVDVDFSPD